MRKEKYANRRFQPERDHGRFRALNKTNVAVVKLMWEDCGVNVRFGNIFDFLRGHQD